jgi:hypothetical protein
MSLPRNLGQWLIFMSTCHGQGVLLFSSIAIPEPEVTLYIIAYTFSVRATFKAFPPHSRKLKSRDYDQST